MNEPRKLRGIYFPVTFACELEQAVGVCWHRGPHRTLVNAATSVMFWGKRIELTPLIIDLDDDVIDRRKHGLWGSGPGSIWVEDIGPTNSLRASAVLWFGDERESLIIEQHWPGAYQAAMEWGQSREPYNSSFSQNRVR